MCHVYCLKVFLALFLLLNSSLYRARQIIEGKVEEICITITERRIEIMPYEELKELAPYVTRSSELKQQNHSRNNTSKVIMTDKGKYSTKVCQAFRNMCPEYQN